MLIYVMVFIGGFAALSWEVLWQIKSSLALGSSAWGTAVTLAVTMGGMCLGSLAMGRMLKDKSLATPLALYGCLEVLIGLYGLLLTVLFATVENIDSYAFALHPDYIKLTNIFCVVLVLLFPTFCMGATIPVLGLLSRRYKTSISFLYGINTLGAALGVLACATILIPTLGLSGTILFISSLNFSIGLIAIAASFLKQESLPSEIHVENIMPAQTYNFCVSLLIVFVTGFCTFALEIAWFRMITASFHSTTDAFAIMLGVFLLGLGAAGSLVRIFKISKIPLSRMVFIAAILVLIATPIIERFDYGFVTKLDNPYKVVLQWFLGSLYILGLPIFFLGLPLPWILAEQSTTKRWSILYSVNTLGAIFGAILTAWFLLPLIGAVQSALLAGFLLLILAILLASSAHRVFYAVLGISVLTVCFSFQSGIGKSRIQGSYFLSDDIKVLESFEGPNSTVSAIAYPNGGRVLVIDGFVAALETNPYRNKTTENYMAWMGHLPMLLHPDPKQALVICMGTGQTLNAVRKENPESIDIVDINPRVFKLAHNFNTNEKVLEDPRVHKTVMDGRAFIRRTSKTYDIITLEPMPPSFAGVNALYSHEFYQMARQKMSSKGIIAQWIPFHLMAPYYSASVTKTFLDIFPNSLLWLDPISQTGILMGSKDESIPLGLQWPGYLRNNIMRNLEENDVKAAVFLDKDRLKRFAASGEIINDNNQKLAYGEAVFLLHTTIDWQAKNMEILEKIKSRP